MSELLTSRQAADLLGLNIQTIYNWRCARKKLSYIKVGRLCMYERTELERFINESRVVVNEQ